MTDQTPPMRDSETTVWFAVVRSGGTFHKPADPCPNYWHRSAESRLGQECPECPAGRVLDNDVMHRTACGRSTVAGSRRAGYGLARNAYRWGMIPCHLCWTEWPAPEKIPATRSPWKMGPTIRACYVSVGKVLLLTEHVRQHDGSSWWGPATNLRDAVAVQVIGVDVVRPQRRLNYTIRAVRLDDSGAQVALTLLGQNAIAQAVAR